ncbi:MAG: hypothetical protein K2K48_01370 [Anaeroplasmataceae bacterium]|nr:hypothetical protein [Anaeroplasmataceae bacterium]MDE6414040.1 hypothetical protein [Anaeroplasmataceae bacterium]
MDIFTDYANWKFENHDFIFQLVNTQSKTISRFTAVIAVVDYLYDKYIKKGTLTSDEEVFFSVGFDYIHDNFYTIKTILDYKFNGDYTEMERFAKTINLLLYVHEFQSELLNQNLDLTKDMKPLDTFEETINGYLDRKEEIPDALFPMLDDIVNPIFEKNNIELNPIESIYYEIALEYGIYKNNEFDMYNAVFNLQKEKKHN